MRHQRHIDPLRHMNDDHADELLLTARAFAGQPHATAARAEHIDRSGIDLSLDTPTGPMAVRVRFTDPIPEADYPGGVRVAFVRLVRAARTTLAGASEEASPPP